MFFFLLLLLFAPMNSARLDVDANNYVIFFHLKLSTLGDLCNLLLINYIIESLKLFNNDQII